MVALKMKDAKRGKETFVRCFLVFVAGFTVLVNLRAFNLLHDETTSFHPLQKWRNHKTLADVRSLLDLVKKEHWRTDVPDLAGTGYSNLSAIYDAPQQIAFPNTKESARNTSTSASGTELFVPQIANLTRHIANLTMRMKMLELENTKLKSTLNWEQQQHELAQNAANEAQVNYRNAEINYEIAESRENVLKSKLKEMQVTEDQLRSQIRFQTLQIASLNASLNELKRVPFSPLSRANIHLDQNSSKVQNNSTVGS